MLKQISKLEALNLAIDPVNAVYALVKINPHSTLLEVMKMEQFYINEAKPAEDPVKETDPADDKPAGTNKKNIDMGKVHALLDGGWSVPKIADELGVSNQTIYNRLEEERNNG